MAVISLPLTFTNSFWSQDYRKGLEVLFAKLDQGVAENDEIIAFFRGRAAAEARLAASLSNLTRSQETGFGADDGASLLMAFRGLQGEAETQGKIHKTIAHELDTLVTDPFDDWALKHRQRLMDCKYTVIDNWLRSYEQAQGEVAKLKHDYLAKTRRADEAEDDAKFAPNSEIGDKFTSSPTKPGGSPRIPPQRTASVSERIAQRLKEIQRKSAGALAAATTDTSDTADTTSQTSTIIATEENTLPRVDKGKGKAVDEGSSLALPESHSPLPMSPVDPPTRRGIPGPPSPMPPMPPPPILLAGLSLPPVAVSQLLTRAASELPLRPIRFPLLGEYQDCFNGEELVAWLNENVQGFGGSLDRAEDAARDLTEKEGLIRRLGEFGNQFEHADDAFYQFRPKAFNLGSGESDNKGTSTPLGTLKGNLAPPAAAGETLLKRTGTFVNLVSKALAQQASGPTTAKSVQEAQEADKTYRVGVRRLDRHRLALEERLEDTLKLLQVWEGERLQAVKSALLQFQGTLANLPKLLEPTIDRSATLISAYQPDSDLNALIERYRTGPFRPHPQIYESVSHDESDVVFGIDLRRWAEGGWNAIAAGEETKEPIPPVLSFLLDGLKEAYGKLANDSEKRKSWIYDVPLPGIHHLREALNAAPEEKPFDKEILAKYDAPVIAATIKLWVLELEPPLALYEGWDEIRKLYPTVGHTANLDGEDVEEQRIRDVGAALIRLPRVHLLVLDALVSHWKTLIETTKVDEANDVYITKLALSVGRTIIRPKFETEMTIQDRHPTLLFIDLIKHYAAILPPTIARKKRDSERKIPLRKRTAPVDMRLSRSRISIDADPAQLLAAQQVAQNPSLVKAKSPTQIAQPQPVPASSAPPLSATRAPPPKVPAPPPQLTKKDADMTPTRPSFKDPPAEFDDPPRPQFKEPKPDSDAEEEDDDDEDDDDDDDDDDDEEEEDEDEGEKTPPKPKFADPPADEYPPRPKFNDPPPEPEVAPSPPHMTNNPPMSQSRANRQSSLLKASTPPAASRSPSPPSEDQPLNSGRTNISRISPGAGAAGQIRGPRISRGPRAPAGAGGVSGIVSNLNRNSVAGSPTSAGSSPVTPGYKRLSSQK